MERGSERSEEALGLRLVRAYLTLPPEKRRRLMQFVEELSRELDRPNEGAGASPK